MLTFTTRSSLILAAFAVIGTLHYLTAAGQPSQSNDNPAALVGSWNSIDRHVAIASLFQPEHGVRKRDAVVHFVLTDGKLTGHVVAEDGQTGWKDNRTQFRSIAFTGDRLTFDFNITYNKTKGPLAVETGRIDNKGTVRIEATLKNNRLTGTWKMFLSDNTEVFRGEWEASKVKPAERK